MGIEIFVKEMMKENIFVTPLIGAGIEITITSQTPFKPKVAPLIDAGIEIEQLLLSIMKSVSHLLLVCGLKLFS